MRNIYVLFLCLMSSSTLVSTSMPSTQGRIEDTIISLVKRVNKMEERLLSLEYRETPDLMKYQEEMNKLTAKMEAIEALCMKQENDLHMKFQEFDEKTLSKMEILQLNESLQSLDKTVKEELQPNQAELKERVKHIEERNYLLGSVEEKEKNSTNTSANFNEDYSLCGREPSIQIDDGLDSHWLWLAHLYTGDNVQCGGSVISRHFILTAARCLHDLQSNEISVRLGLRNSRYVTLLQEFKPKKFHIHPMYDYQRFYDYDIALIELEEPIDYNIYISPVCLPRGGTLAGSRDVLLIGNENIKNGEIKEKEMRIEDRIVCKQSLVKQSLFTDRLFCAREKEISYTCIFGTGGPVVQSHVNKENRTVWTQVGIVGWGESCGRGNPFTFCTDLRKFMPWVDSIINEETKR